MTSARADALKAVFLITDGFSNGGNPVPISTYLKEHGVEIFTFGIENGDVLELRQMASQPHAEHTFILESFQEFEALARRALHEGEILRDGRHTILDHCEGCG